MKPGVPDNQLIRRPFYNGTEILVMPWIAIEANLRVDAIVYLIIKDVPGNSQCPG